jgi:mersacidin/lichenicidin family type 2 lantibiotic
MSKNDVIRAWKDPNYRKSLSAAEQAALPPNPAGAIELTDEEAASVAGGIFYTVVCSKYCQTIICPTAANCPTFVACTVSFPCR